MKKAIELLKTEFELNNVKQQPILDSNYSIVGYHSYAQNINDETLSGGTHTDRAISLRICVAELLERYFFKKICDLENANTFLIDEFPSTSGFAAGFDNESTKFRAICEGLERWAWSQWIDGHYILPKMEAIENTNMLSRTLLKDFDSFELYSRRFCVSINNKKANFEFLVFLGFKNNGIFAGSRVSSSKDNLIEHAIIEAHRNLKNAEFYKNNPDKIDMNSPIVARLIYFSNNKITALNQINQSTIANWPQPKVALLKDFSTNLESVYLWRCLFSNYIGWHLGDETRFVY